MSLLYQDPIRPGSSLHRPCGGKYGLGYARTSDGRVVGGGLHVHHMVNDHAGWCNALWDWNDSVDAKSQCLLVHSSLLHMQLMVSRVELAPCHTHCHVATQLVPIYMCKAMTFMRCPTAYRQQQRSAICLWDLRSVLAGQRNLA